MSDSDTASSLPVCASSSRMSVLTPAPPTPTSSGSHGSDAEPRAAVRLPPWFVPSSRRVRRAPAPPSSARHNAHFGRTAHSDEPSPAYASSARKNAPRRPTTVAAPASEVASLAAASSARAPGLRAVFAAAADASAIDSAQPAFRWPGSASTRLTCEALALKQLVREARGSAPPSHSAAVALGVSARTAGPASLLRVLEATTAACPGPAARAAAGLAVLVRRAHPIAAAAAEADVAAWRSTVLPARVHDEAVEPALAELHEATRAAREFGAEAQRLTEWRAATECVVGTEIAPLVAAIERDIGTIDASSAASAALQRLRGRCQYTGERHAELAQEAVRTRDLRLELSKLTKLQKTLGGEINALRHDLRHFPPAATLLAQGTPDAPTSPVSPTASAAPWSSGPGASGVKRETTVQTEARETRDALEAVRSALGVVVDRRAQIRYAHHAASVGTRTAAAIGESLRAELARLRAEGDLLVSISSDAAEARAEPHSHGRLTPRPSVAAHLAIAPGSVFMVHDGADDDGKREGEGEGGQPLAHTATLSSQDVDAVFPAAAAGAVRGWDTHRLATAPLPTAMRLDVLGRALDTQCALLRDCVRARDAATLEAAALLSADECLLHSAVPSLAAAGATRAFLHSVAAAPAAAIGAALGGRWGITGGGDGGAAPVEEICPAVEWADAESDILSQLRELCAAALEMHSATDADRHVRYVAALRLFRPSVDLSQLAGGGQRHVSLTSDAFDSAAGAKDAPATAVAESAADRVNRWSPAAVSRALSMRGVAVPVVSVAASSCLAGTGLPGSMLSELTQQLPNVAVHPEAHCRIAALCGVLPLGIVGCHAAVVKSLREHLDAEIRPISGVPATQPAAALAALESRILRTAALQALRRAYREFCLGPRCLALSTLDLCRGLTVAPAAVVDSVAPGVWGHLRWAQLQWAAVLAAVIAPLEAATPCADDAHPTRVVSVAALKAAIGREDFPACEDGVCMRASGLVLAPPVPDASPLAVAQWVRELEIAQASAVRSAQSPRRGTMVALHRGPSGARFTQGGRLRSSAGVSATPSRRRSLLAAVESGCGIGYRYAVDAEALIQAAAAGLPRYSGAALTAGCTPSPLDGVADWVDADALIRRFATHVFIPQFVRLNHL